MLPGYILSGHPVLPGYILAGHPVLPGHISAGHPVLPGEKQIATSSFVACNKYVYMSGLSLNKIIIYTSCALIFGSLSQPYHATANGYASTNPTATGHQSHLVYHKEVY